MITINIKIEDMEDFNHPVFLSDLAQHKTVTEETILASDGYNVFIPEWLPLLVKMAEVLEIHYGYEFESFRKAMLSLSEEYTSKE